MVKTYIGLLFVFLNVHFISPAQENKKCADQLHEMVYLHLSRNTIALGETLYFKAYIFDKIPDKKNKSEILYIQLFDDEKILKGNFKAYIKDNSCESSIVIPDTLQAGHYSIVAYTNLMRNYPSSTYFCYDLFIAGVTDIPEDFNTSDLINSTYEPLSSDSFTIFTESSDIQISLNNNLFKTKEQIVIDLNIPGNNKDSLSNISISVSEISPGNLFDINPDIKSFFYTVIKNEDSGSRFKNLNSAFVNYTNWNEFSDWNYKVENNGFRIEGTVFDKDLQQPAERKEILLCVPDSFANLKYSISDSLGYFKFILNKNYSNKKLIINVNNDNEINEYYFNFDNKSINADLLNFIEYDIANLKDYFIRCRKIALINKVFSESQPVDNSAKNFVTLKNFYGTPGYTTKLADFIDLEDFNDIAKNVLPGVRFKKKKEKYRVNMRNSGSDKLYFQKNCLVLMNNIPFYDYNYLATLGSTHIDHIDVKIDRVVLGNIDFYGVLSVFTKDKVVISNKHATVIDNNFEKPSGIISNTIKPGESSKFPSFKQLLYWNPDIKFENGKSRLFFNASELKSDYIVDIEGMLDGKPVSKKMVIKIR